MQGRKRIIRWLLPLVKQEQGAMREEALRGRESEGQEEGETLSLGASYGVHGGKVMAKDSAARVRGREELCSGVSEDVNG